METEEADFNGNLTEKPSRRAGTGARLESLQLAILQAEGKEKQSSS